MRIWLAAALLALAGPAAAQTAPCVAVGEPLARADCDRIDALQGRVQAALSRFNAPDPLPPGARAELELRISPANPPTAAGSMAAELSGDGFEISPKGVRRQDVSPGGETRWTWTVSAPAAGAHFLTLATSLQARTPDGRLIAVSSTIRRQRVHVAAAPAPEGVLGRLQALPNPVKYALVIVLGLAVLLLARMAVRALLARRS